MIMCMTKKSLAAIMKECVSADSAHLMKDATAPGDAKAIACNKAILSNGSVGKYNNLLMEWSRGLPNFDQHAYANNSTHSSKQSGWDNNSYADGQSYAASSTTTAGNIQNGLLQILQEIQPHFSTSDKGSSRGMHVQQKSCWFLFFSSLSSTTTSTTTPHLRLFRTFSGFEKIQSYFRIFRGQCISISDWTNI